MAKGKKVRLRELREELRYWQTMARIAEADIRATREKCKQIGAKMREVQAEAKK